MNQLLVPDSHHESFTHNSGYFSSIPNKPNRRVPKTSDDRRHRRMKSNRESARRSRVRKQKHLEDLSNNLNQLEIKNRELNGLFRLALYRDGMVLRENEEFQSEAVMLRRRLWDLRQVLLVREHLDPLSAWTCSDSFTYVNEDQLQGTLPVL